MKIRRPRTRYCDIVVLLFALLPIVDSVNGVMVRSGFGSVGILYKAMIALFLFTYLAVHGALKRKGLGCVLLAVLYILFSYGVNHRIGEVSQVQTGAMVKVIFNIVLFALLMRSVSCGLISGDTIFQILDTTAWVFAAAFLIPYVLGVGYGVYAGGIGYKAFFYSQNEISFAIIVLFYTVLYKVSLKMEILSVIQLLLMLLCGVLINTKSCVFGCLAGMGVWILHILWKEKLRYKIMVTAAAALGTAVLWKKLAKAIGNIIVRFNALDKKYGSSLLTTILSARNVKAEKAYTELIDSRFPVFKTLFGNGFHTGYSVEMDLVDAFFYLGILGAIAVVFFWVILAVKSSGNLRRDGVSVRLFGLLVALFFSFCTGHVIFMATSGCYFALFCCFYLTYSRKQ
ncbi:MAG: O-antigen ligase family protein [Firmicutes bacterium]|nr:O-antigen ligase family protein [Bacillota bacterium]